MSLGLSLWGWLASVDCGSFQSNWLRSATTGRGWSGPVAETKEGDEAAYIRQLAPWL